MSQGDPEFQMQMSAYTRITQLEAENARLTADLNLGSDLSYQFMKQDRDALATRCRELEQDKARLDWLEQQKYGCWGIDAYSGSWQACIETGGESYRGPTLRRCADAAIKGEK